MITTWHFHRRVWEAGSKWKDWTWNGTLYATMPLKFPPLNTGTLNVGSIVLFVGTSEFRFPRLERVVWSSVSLLLRVRNRRMWHCSTGWVGARDFRRGAQKFRGRWNKHFLTVQLRASLRASQPVSKRSPTASRGLREWNNFVCGKLQAQNP